MIRPFKLEDKDYIIDSHYHIYQKEYDYDLTFKDFIESSVNEYIKRLDNSKEKIWILEISGKSKGSIAITKYQEDIAQLRLFLIEPDIRGTGLGSSLLEAAIRFCKNANYANVILWTNQDLKAARKLYKRYGFILKEEKHSFLSNQHLIEERWELKL